MDREKIKYIIHRRLDNIQKAYDSNEEKFYGNVVDPFSAILQAGFLGLNYEDWKELEAARQIQKTYQNAVGTLHQEILATFSGWRDLGTGAVVDLINDEKKIIAEVKNKHNTTKGNHKTQVYRDLKNLIYSSHIDYVGYYVEIIPKKPKPFDKPFTPSDNNTKQRLPVDEAIRVIDGKSFYHLVSGEKHALREVFKLMFEAIVEKTGKPLTFEEYNLLFIRAYGDTK